MGTTDQVVSMASNQSLVVCESVLARLNAALEVARAEAVRARAAEDQIGALLSRVLTREARSEIRIDRRETLLGSRRRHERAANDNPAQNRCHLRSA